ncbi:MAG: arginine deiminase [Bacteroidia bacterium]|nr:arginine deiminase [Bacteroidia bacterium]
MLVDTEINRLERVIIHRPDSGIGRITPKRAEELLFDDIVHLPKMIEEHDIFRKILEAFIGKDNVFEVQDLLFEALEADPRLKLILLDRIIDFEELPENMTGFLSELDNKLLSNLLVTGYHKGRDHILFDPIPNFIFTRDIAVTVKDHIIITKALKEARQRENYLTRFIFIAHPLFSKYASNLINLNDINKFPPSKKGERVSIEGGDMMMIEKEYLLIGCSERTTSHAFHSVKNILFEREAIKHVVQVNIPVDRSYMHIDTLFTRINKDDLVCFKPIVYDGLGSNVNVYTKEGLKKSYASTKDFFLNEINPNMNFIFSGDGETPYQEREQWTDGCNLVAVKPGVGITYDRNIHTEKAFKKAGYAVLPSNEFLANCANDSEYAQNLEKTIITIPSGELSRARGGSHCMTCPIKREII